MSSFAYQRLVVAYHGCEERVASNVLAGGALEPSENDYDWLGKGGYFWEHGPARALEWAETSGGKRASRFRQPAVIGALIQLGNCFDLLDVWYTSLLKDLFPTFRLNLEGAGAKLPENKGVYHRLDCAFLNWAIPQVEMTLTTKFDTVRGAFVEGRPVCPGSQIFERTHIQIAVRSPKAILGCFRPSKVDNLSSLLDL